MAGFPVFSIDQNIVDFMGNKTSDFILAIVLAFNISGCHLAPMKLEDLILNKNDLPTGCRIKPVESDEKLPCEANSNPFISSDEIFLDCFSRAIMPKQTSNGKVHQALFSVYEDSSGIEIGLFALEMKSENDAEDIWEDLVADGSDLARNSYFQQGKIVIWLWCDQLESKQFTDFRNLILDIIE